VLLKPLPIRPARVHTLLDLFVADHAALHRIHQKHAPRLKTVLVLDVFRCDRKNAGLRSQHHKAVMRDGVAARPQTVAVQRRAYVFSICKSNSRGGVPRLHKRCMCFWVLHASGISIIMACGSERPPCTSSSMALSIFAESEPTGEIIGKIFCMSPLKSSERSTLSRACIQFTLPFSVLISPLWAI